MGILGRVKNLNTLVWLGKCARRHTGSLIAILSMNIIVSISSVAVAVVSRQAIDLAVKQDMKHALAYAFAFAALILTRVGMNGLASLLAARTSEKMSYCMQNDLIRRMCGTEWTALARYHSGDILTRLTSDVGNIVYGWVSLAPNMISLVVQLVVAFCTLLTFDSTLAVFAFVLGPVSALFSWFFGRRFKKMQHCIQQAESRCRAFMHELVEHMLIIKTFGYDRNCIDHLAGYQQEKFKWVVKRNKLGVMADLTLSAGYWTGYFLAFGWGAFKLSSGSASFGTFTAFLQLVGQVQGPFDGLSRSIPQIISAVTSAERLMEIESLDPEISKPGLFKTVMDMPVGLYAEHVSFGYERDNPILKDVSFRVMPGETVALTGISGEGKTTVIRILLSLVKPGKGLVCLSGWNNRLRPLSPDTRSYFSYVPQGNTLFSGTIEDNLRIGCRTASREELVDAARLSCVWDFIESLPDGLDTRVGERGLGLSEGQAQRLCIARAILRPAPILLLDEATSALDIETERTVLENIRNMRPARTCIAITHRLSVLGICDRVYHLSEGTLTERFTDNIERRRIADAP